MKEYIVNYFDLGPHLGQEIDSFLRQVNKIACVSEVNIIAIEPSKKHFLKLKKKYRSNKKIRFQFINKAIASRPGFGRLYDHKLDMGRTIYKDKNGAKNSYSLIRTEKLSNIVRKFLPKKSNSINILKANIEGAELDMVLDLWSSGLFYFFDLYLSSMPGQYWDIQKVRGFREDGSVNQIKKILKENNIYIKRFSKIRTDWFNVDIAREINVIANKRKEPFLGATLSLQFFIMMARGHVLKFLGKM